MYKRRIPGTIFVLTLSCIEVVFVIKTFVPFLIKAYKANFTNLCIKMGEGMALSFATSCFVRLCYHLHVLNEPSFTAPRGDYFYFLNFVMLSFVSNFYSILLGGMALISQKFGTIETLIYLAIRALPGLVAIVEAIIYCTEDNSSCFLKQLKPWQKECDQSESSD